jgi:hypothetical protein
VNVSAFDIHSLDDAREALACAFQKAGVQVSARGYLREDTFRLALKKADQWLRDGVSVLTREEFKAPDPWIHDLPPVFFSIGNKSMLELPAATILNSRKPRRLTPDDRWLLETKRLVRLAIEEGFAIVSSIGNIPYCTVSRLSKGSPTIIVCDDVLPCMGSQKTAFEFLSTYHDLFHFGFTIFLSSFSPGARPRSDVRSAERDHLVAALASLLLVAEVRDGGNMQEVLNVAAKRAVKIVGYQRSSSNLPSFSGSTKRKTALSGASVSDGQAASPRPRYRRCAGLVAARSGRVRLFDLYDPVNDLPWLIHYTRSCPGPWPGQSIAEYCQSLINGGKSSCHTPFDTLARILNEGLIRASNRLTRGSCAVVCFSECLPAKLHTFIKWRKGLSRWSFEPYGIAVPLDILANLGAKPVIYGSQEDFKQLTADSQHLFQVQCSSSDDWTSEKEWRVLGNFPLSRTILKEMVVIVRTQDQAEAVAHEFGCRVALAGV